MKNGVKLGLMLCSAILGISAVVLAIHIWQSTPFFDMTLVFLDVVLVLLMAASLAIALMSNSD